MEGKDLSVLVCVVTGTVGALGKVTSFSVASVGAMVVTAGRSMTKLDYSKEEIIQRDGGELKGYIESMVLLGE